MYCGRADQSEGRERLSGAKVAALILAAGYSSRMGDFKPLLPLGRATVIERAVSGFLGAGIRDVRVVVGHRAEEVIRVLEPLGVRTVFNAAYDSGMYSSVVAGVGSLPPGEVDAFFLLPGDNPLVKPQTIRELVNAYRESRAGIVYPCFMGRRGHPPLIDMAYTGDILAGEQPGGLRTVLGRYESLALNVEVVDQGVLLDIDTPADYREVLAFSLKEDVPGEQECLAILDRFKVSPEITAHARLVTDLARKLALLLNEAGLDLDLDLITAAGLLHDLAKGQRNHAQAGAEALTQLAYPRVAEVVSLHMDLPPGQGPGLDEVQIIYLADKLTQGDRLVPLSERLKACLDRFAGRQDVSEAAVGRLRDAEEIGKRVEAVLGMPLERAIFEGAEPADGREADLPGQTR